MSVAAPLPHATKTHRDENFPVASRLIAGPLREAVLAFYRYVRAADDIADSPDLSPEEKLVRLDRLEAALVAADPAEPLAAGLAAMDRRHGAGVAEARLLLGAFRQDAVQRRYRDWAELVEYCRRSADPVGRFLLRLHGEGEEARGPADALCTALQILNHLQDLVPDREGLDRIYLPVPWMERAGGESAFFEPMNRGPRRAVLDAALDRVDALVDTARGLPSRVRSRRLAAESAVTVALAAQLARRLRTGDPVTERVALKKPDFARAFAHGIEDLARGRPNRDREVTRRVVAGSGSSFKLGMASLAAERRRAIHAVYAFCRVIDDIADGAAPPAEKSAALRFWREEIDRLRSDPQTPIGRELALASRRYALPLEELHALLDGMESDAADRVRIPDDAALDLYCRRVAGAVGVLSIHIFGVPQARDFALSLGRTLQIVNILRDIDEDARLERVYLPLDRLAAVGIPDGPAAAIAADPRIERVCLDLAAEARTGFAAADAALDAQNRAALKPAVLMMEGYRRIFRHLEARGFARRGDRVRLGTREKFELLALSLRRAP